MLVGSRQAKWWRARAGPPPQSSSRRAWAAHAAMLSCSCCAAALGCCCCCLLSSTSLACGCGWVHAGDCSGGRRVAACAGDAAQHRCRTSISSSFMSVMDLSGMILGCEAVVCRCTHERNGGRPRQRTLPAPHRSWRELRAAARDGHHTQHCTAPSRELLRSPPPALHPPCRASRSSCPSRSRRARPWAAPRGGPPWA